jgi:hypothetical protein
VAARLFTHEEIEGHSTWRELENIHFSLKAFVSKIKGSNVKFFVDNKYTVSIIENGSMKLECHQFALEVFNFCGINNIFVNRMGAQIKEQRGRLHF